MQHDDSIVWEDVSLERDGGVLKKLLRPGQGELPAQDGSMKIKVVLHAWYFDPRGKKRMVLEPTEMEPHHKWFVLGQFNEKPPIKGLDQAVASMCKGEVAEFKIHHRYGYGKDGGTVAGTKPLRRVPGETTVHYKVEVLTLKVPQPKRWQISNVERMRRATACKEEGVRLFREGLIQEAVRQFRDGSDYSSCVSPDESREFVYGVRVPVCLNAAVCCLQLEKWKEALGHADDALKMDKDSVKGWYLRAKSLAQLERWEEAKESIVKAVKMEPTNAKSRLLYEEIKPHVATKGSQFRFSKVFAGDIYEDNNWAVAASIFSEMVWGFLCWSLLAPLAAQIWFFPLEYMDVTGYELLILSIFSPLLLHVPRIDSLAQRQLVHPLAAVLLTIAVRVQLLLPRVVLLALATSLSLLGIFSRMWRALPWLGLSGVLVGIDRLYWFSRSSLYTNSSVSLFLLMPAVALAYWLRNPAVEPLPTKRFSPAAGASLGSLLFLFHWFVLQPGVWSRCLGLPVLPLAYVVVLSTLGGLVAPLAVNPRVRKAVAAVPCLSVAVLLNYPSLVIVAVFMFSLSYLWRPVGEQAASRPRIATAVTVIVTWLLHFLASIWTVAYNFVPFGGTVMREQTHVHLVVAAGLAGLSALGHGWSKRKESPSERKRLLVVALVLVLLLVPVVWTRFQSGSRIKYRAAKAARADGGEIRAMAWAVHFGYDNFGRSSFPAVAEVIRENKANVVGLLETDVTRPFTENWDVLDYLSTELGMHSDFGPSTLNNTWGCSLLSVYPIVHVERWMLPSPQGELACIMDATLRVAGRHVHVVVTHFGNHVDAIDRQQQTNEVAELMERNRNELNLPHIFLGYLTNKPLSVHYLQLLLAGWNDASPLEKKRWCLYIFYRDLEVVDFRRYDTGDTSDTEAQIASFRFLPPGFKGKQPVEKIQEEILMKRLQEL